MATFCSRNTLLLLKLIYFLLFAGWWVPHASLLPSRKQKLWSCELLPNSNYVFLFCQIILAFPDWVIVWLLKKSVVFWISQITVNADRTVVAFYKFLKKHAAVPFKLEKTVSTPKPDSSDAKESSEGGASDVKDELWVLSQYHQCICSRMWPKRSHRQH